VEWARRGEEWAARARWTGRATGSGSSWRVAAERAVPEGGTVALTLDGDAGLHPDAARWSWRLGAARSRVGVTVELPARRARTAWAFLETPTGGGTRLAARGRWAVGRRPTFEIEWTRRAAAGRSRSTR
jgi:hypothetical protein